MWYKGEKCYIGSKIINVTQTWTGTSSVSNRQPLERTSESIVAGPSTGEYTENSTVEALYM